MSDLFDLPFEEEEEEPSRPPTVQAPVRRILSVTDLTVRIRDLLEGELF